MDQYPMRMDPNQRSDHPGAYSANPYSGQYSNYPPPPQTRSNDHGSGQYPQSYNAATDLPQNSMYYPPAGPGPRGAGAGQEEEAYYYENDRTVQNKWTDWVCAIIFLLQFIASFVISCICLAKFDFVQKIGNITIEMDARFLGVLFAIFLPGLVFGFFWMCVGRCLSGYFIRVSLVLLLVLLTIPCIMAIAAGETIYYLVMLSIASFSIIYYLCVVDRIPFTEALIQSSFVALSHNKMAYVLHLVNILVAYVISLFLISGAVVGICYYGAANINSDSISGDITVLVFVAAICISWTGTTFQGISFVTTAGAVGTWWYTSPSSTTRSSNPSLASFGRAVTTSLGSVAFGALIVSIVEFFYRQSKAMRKHTVNPCLCICAWICLSFTCWCKVLFRIFNSFAYCQIALYGKDYISASKASFSLLQKRGLFVAMDASLLHFAVLLGGMIGGGFTAAMAQVTLTMLFDISSDSFITSLVRLIAFSIGTEFTKKVLNIMHAATTATFVVYAEDPATCASNRPEKYQELEKALQKA